MDALGLAVKLNRTCLLPEVTNDVHQHRSTPCSSALTVTPRFVADRGGPVSVGARHNPQRFFSEPVVAAAGMGWGVHLLVALLSSLLGNVL
jgi:hypothetical protein